MTIITDHAALAQRVAQLEAEVCIWRAAAVAEDAYANLRAQAGSAPELAAFDRLHRALTDRAPLRAQAILAARAPRCAA